MENYTLDVAQLPEDEGDFSDAQESPGSRSVAPAGNAQKAAGAASRGHDEEDDILADYTIDLGGFGDKPSSIVVNDREVEGDEVPSEDEGPEDFTMNMEKWMRGGESWKKPREPEAQDEDVHDMESPEAVEAELQHDADDEQGDSELEGLGQEIEREQEPLAGTKSMPEPEQQSDQKSGLQREPEPKPEQKREQNESQQEKGSNCLEQVAPGQPVPESSCTRSDNHAGGIDEESLFEPSSASTPASHPSRDVDREARDLTRDHRPPSLVRSATQEQEQASEEIFERISALQAEVERMRKDKEEDARKNSELKKAKEAERIARDKHEELQSQFEESKDQISQLRAELERVWQSDSDEIERLKREIDEQKHDVETEREKCLAMARETTKPAEKADHHVIKPSPEMEDSNCEVERLEKEVEQLLQSHLDEVARLQGQIHEAQLDVENERSKCVTLAHEAAKLAEGRQHDEHALQDLRDEESARRTELEHAHSELQETRRIVEDVEDENDRLTERLESSAQELAEVREQLQTRSTELKASHTTIAELRGTQQAADDDRNRERHDMIRQQLVADHEAALAALKDQHIKDRQSFRCSLQKATKARQTSEQGLKRTHNSEISVLKKRISTLESQLSEQQEASSTHSIEDELRSAIRVLSNKLEKSYAATRSARAEADEARQAAASVMEANKIVNEELEARFTETIEKREREWMRRANLLFRERDKMGQALLQSWGREEVGRAEKGEKQGYRYRYAKGRF